MSWISPQLIKKLHHQPGRALLQIRKSALKKKKIPATLKDLAQATGESPTTLNQFEKGMPSKFKQDTGEVVKKYLEYLQIAPEDVPIITGHYGEFKRPLTQKRKKAEQVSSKSNISPKSKTELLVIVENGTEIPLQVRITRKAGVIFLRIDETEVPLKDATWIAPAVTKYDSKPNMKERPQVSLTI